MRMLFFVYLYGTLLSYPLHIQNTVFMKKGISYSQNVFYMIHFITFAFILRVYKFIYSSIALDSEPDGANIQSSGRSDLVLLLKFKNLNHTKGVYTPQNCNLPGPGYKVAIIIPFRDITKDPWTNRPVFELTAYSLFGRIVLKLSTDP